MQFLKLAERRDLAILTAKQIDVCIQVLTTGEPPQTPCIRQAVTFRLFLFCETKFFGPMQRAGGVYWTRPTSRSGV